jgi:poly-gamma-glutamate synthesis protein (capsule biosynthesis protein)
MLRTLFFVAVLLCHTLPGSAQTDTLRLLFAGDIMGHSPQIQSAQVVKNQKYNYAPCFQYLKPLLEGADLAIGNLELTLPGKPPYTGYPMFRSPDDLARDLKAAGFDLLVTANNHSNDARGPGVVNTIQTLRDLGFLQTGTFKNRRDRDAFYPLMVYKNNFKIALLNYTYDTNGIPTEPPTIVNLIDTVQMRADLEEAVARKPHYIIAIMHWGLEYQLNENATQRSLARFLIRHGADMVIGMHPHVVQPIKTERVKLPDGSTKEAIVAYSLGNFISNQRQPNTDGGILFQVDLLKQKGSPRVRVGKQGYIPIWRYMHQPPGGKLSYHALPVARMEREPQLFKGMGDSARANMRKFAAALRQRLDWPEWR